MPQKSIDLSAAPDTTWTASSDVPWLLATTTSGTGSGQVEFWALDTSALPSGIYAGHIIIRVQDQSGSQIGATITVTFAVVPYP